MCSFFKVAQAHGDGLIVKNCIKNVNILSHEKCAFSLKYIKENVFILNISIYVSKRTF